MKSDVRRVADILRSKGATSATIRPTDTIAALSEALKAQRVGAMVVSENGETVDGIISERDVAYGVASCAGDLRTLPVSALMTRKVVTCSPDDSIAEVTKVMTERHIRHLPVADGNRLAGIISIRDVVFHRIDEVERLAQLVTGHASR